MLNFLGIGAQKAGTSWLHENLARHPNIRFPYGKEIHFWNQPGERTLAWYQDVFGGVPADLCQGEITPAYAVLPVETIREIHRWFPDVRLIYLMRNPIERAWSSALMALRLAELEYDEASDAWFIDHLRSRGSTMRGDYEQNIRNWLSVFPREQLLLRQFELIKTNPRALLTACARHIGVDWSYWHSEESHLAARPVFRGIRHPIRPSLLPVVAEIYTPKIESLSAYLGWDLTAWLPEAGAAVDRDRTSV